MQNIKSYWPLAVVFAMCLGAVFLRHRRREVTQQLAFDAFLCVSLVCQGFTGEKFIKPVIVVPDSVSTFLSVKPLQTVKKLLGQIPAVFVATITF